MSTHATDIAFVGASIPELVREPSAVQLFQFSAITWNSHRIHYDRDYAIEERFPDVVVQAHLHACFLAQAVLEACGAESRLERIAWQNRGIAVPGDRLTISGEVVNVETANAGTRLEFGLEERNQRDELCVKGSAVVFLPMRAT